VAAGWFSLVLVAALGGVIALGVTVSRSWDAGAAAMMSMLCLCGLLTWTATIRPRVILGPHDIVWRSAFTDRVIPYQRVAYAHYDAGRAWLELTDRSTVEGGAFGRGRLAARRGDAAARAMVTELTKRTDLVPIDLETPEPRARDRVWLVWVAMGLGLVAIVLITIDQR
jgi:hypothetical protein